MADEIVNLGAADKVIKGGEVWLELTINRNAKGVEFWIRTDPRVEEFIRTLNEGDEGTDTLEAYGRGWASIDAAKPVQVIRNNRVIDTHTYSLSTIGGVLTGNPIANIAFLRFVGVGTPDGVKFRISGPMGRDSIRTIKENIMNGCRQLFRDYIVPVHINLRVTSTEL